MPKKKKCFCTVPHPPPSQITANPIDPKVFVETRNHKVLCAIVNEALETIPIRTIMNRSKLSYGEILEALEFISKGFPER